MHQAAKIIDFFVKNDTIDWKQYLAYLKVTLMAGAYNLQQKTLIKIHSGKRISVKQNRKVALVVMVTVVIMAVKVSGQSTAKSTV